MTFVLGGRRVNACHAYLRKASAFRESVHSRLQAPDGFRPAPF